MSGIRLVDQQEEHSIFKKPAPSVSKSSLLWCIENSDFAKHVVTSQKLHNLETCYCRTLMTF